MMIILKNKKAQFYLFTMIILLAMVTTFIIAKPVSIEIDRSFDYYFENIDRESEYVVNKAIQNEANVSEELNIFFTHMYNLGKTKRITLQHLYLLVNSTDLTFHNAMDSEVFVVNYNQTISSGEGWTTGRTDVSKVAFQVKEGIPDLSSFIYKFYITDEDNQLAYLLFAKRGDQYDLRMRDNSE